MLPPEELGVGYERVEPRVWRAAGRSATSPQGASRYVIGPNATPHGVRSRKGMHMPEECPVTHPGAARRLLRLGVLSLLAACVLLLLAERGKAAPYTGGFSPRIITGKADLNGDLVVNGRDDANAFYGDTSIIDGMLDCDAWAVNANDGGAGDGIINSADDCQLVGFNGTPSGVVISVVNGVFQRNGLLPTVFNVANPDDPDIGNSDFAWSAIDGRVDSNGNEAIDLNGDDCHVGLIGKTVDMGLGDATDGADILGNSAGNTNPCGFAIPPNTAHNGLVDLNDDQGITTADSCSNSCFFGHDVMLGVVQAECPGFAGDPRNDVVGTPGADTLIGTGGNDVICGLGGRDTLVGKAGNDLLLGGRGADVLGGGDGRDLLKGQGGNDRLFGNAGRDRLDGGAGFDRGFGGPGRDTFVRCEVRSQ